MNEKKERVIIYFTEEEIEYVIFNLYQCQSDGYLKKNDPAFDALMKFERARKLFHES